MNPLIVTLTDLTLAHVEMLTAKSITNGDDPMCLTFADISGILTDQPILIRRKSHTTWRAEK